MPAEITIESCDACGECADACPTACIEVGDYAVVNPDDCTECELCVGTCPSESILMA